MVKLLRVRIPVGKQKEITLDFNILIDIFAIEGTYWYIDHSGVL